jgi:ABC-type glycerol-3-phosphate transport system substrate-binding protein
MGTAPGESFAGGEYLAVTAKTSNRQRAREFVQFMTQGENAIRMCAKIPEAGFPADKRFFADSSLMKDPVKAVFARQLEFARMTPVHPRWLDLEAVIEKATVRVLLGELTAKEALDEAQDEALIITRK